MPDGDLHESLTDLLASDGIDRERLREIVAFIGPVDLAEFLEDLDLEDRVRIFDVLDAERAARVLEALPHDPRVQLVDRIGEQRLSEVVEKMSPDAVADIIDHLPAHREQAILDKVEEQHRRRIETLRKYSPTVAGGLMTTNYVAVPENFTAAETLKAIQGAVNADTIEYIYVVDGDDRLVGVCSIRGILRAAAETPVSELMRRDVHFVGATVDQEEVAKIVQKYDLKALPVIDNTMKLIGVVTQARVLEVIHQEAGEDIAKLAGAAHLDPVHAPVFKRVRLRLPWLLTAMCIELGLAWVMSLYDKTLAANVLTYFIPIIMAMGGNVGLQSSTSVVRGLATGTIGSGRAWRVLGAEAAAGNLIGLLCGVCTGAMALLMSLGRGPALKLSLIVAGSMVTSITIAAAVGTLIPFILNRLRKDPAIASGPFITAFNDMLNVTIYLTLATLLLTR